MPHTPKLDPLGRPEEAPYSLFDPLKKLMDDLLDDDRFDWESDAGQIAEFRISEARQFLQESYLACNRGHYETATTMALYFGLQALLGSLGGEFEISPERSKELISQHATASGLKGALATNAIKAVDLAQILETVNEVQREHPPDWPDTEVARVVLRKRQEMGLGTRPGEKQIARIISEARTKQA